MCVSINSINSINQRLTKRDQRQRLTKRDQRRRCAALASALRDGALPALMVLGLDGNPASEEAVQAVLASRSGLAPVS